MRPYRSNRVIRTRGGRGRLAEAVAALDVKPKYAFTPSAKLLDWAWARGVLLLTAVLHTVAFPPYNVPEAAFIFVVPVFLYAVRKPGWVEFLVVTYAAFFLSWLVLLEWLRHVTIGGTIALAGVVALFPLAWCAALRWAVPRAPWNNLLARVFLVLGLAGLWVVQEWVRSWFLSGFPWLTLATSQWQRPIMLQGASFAGAWLVGFTLLAFNLGLASYLQRLVLWVKERRGRFSPEFYVAILLLFGSTFGFYAGSGPEREPLLRAGVMQPYIPQEAKWDETKVPRILAILEAEIKDLGARGVDVIFGPEAVMPVPLLGDPVHRQWLENLARETATPIVLGAVGYEPASGRGPAPGGVVWRNGVFVVAPDAGVQPAFYSKRHLVPMGEYVPLRSVFPGVAKFVPIGSDFTPGTSALPLLLQAGGRFVQLGALICYEDVFGGLSRASVRAGADVLFVATNDAWYGETGAAHQHAAHSVVRAVETRRPVIRAGNGGWSGWIDESGLIRRVSVNAEGRVYFRGVDTFDVTVDPRWAGRETLYVQHGDWFVVVAFGFAMAAAFLLRSSHFNFPAAPAAPPEPG